MINFVLILSIIAFLAYAFYEQFGLDKRCGNTLFKIPLKKRTKIDSFIFILLIIVIIWQSNGEITAYTLYLLGFLILLSLYLAFFRTPQLIIKQTGFFFENLFIHFDKIKQINLAPENKFVFDLTNGKRIIVQLNNAEDIEKLVAFFGGYKEQKEEQ